MRPSLTLIGSVIFFLFIGQSLWSIYSIWQSPKCNPSIHHKCFHSILNDNPKLDLAVYLSDGSVPRFLVLNIKEFDYRNAWDRSVNFTVPKSVRRNGSLYIDTLISATGRSSDQDLKVVVSGLLSQHAVPQSSTFNLLKEEEAGKASKPVPHLKSRYAVYMCTEELHLPHNEIPHEIDATRLLRLKPNGQFLPIAREDSLSQRIKDLTEITKSSTSMSFQYIYSPVSLGKIRFNLQMEGTLRAFVGLGFTEKDIDEVKSVFSDTNLYLLCATLAIGSIHSLLDFLSFKNDVSFWRSQSSMAGLSTRTVLWRAFSHTIVFLFLLDEGTSLLVLVPAGIATIIEARHLQSLILNISLKGITFNRDKTESAAEAETREYDEECMKFLSYLLTPLCLAAAIYSLLYLPHKSWYSWTINSLANGVYAFGFLFMFPQLFINYRLKSVAALPWRVFTYRAFNTFIDDIFAFIITMPTAHRVACLRDDVVFLVYLYQRWLYPVDASRQEGIGGEITADSKSEAIRDKDTKKDK
ncbi:hypothetical protein HUJ04_008445 [Dendroctonus ponderosae]|nr:hypothetical protein HUJ04_008445 [Dendroctonus ponderosae]